MLRQRICFCVIVVGYALFLTLNSFTLWNLFVFVDGGILGTGSQIPLSVSCFLGNALGFFVIAALETSDEALTRPLFRGAVASLVLGFVILLACGYAGILYTGLIVVAGTLIGIGTTCGFFCWIEVFTRNPPMSIKQEVLLSSALMVVFVPAFHAVPDAYVLLIVAAVLLPLCLITLFAGLRFMPALDRVDAVATIPRREESIRRNYLAELWPSLLSITMVAIICPAIAQISSSSAFVEYANAPTIASCVASLTAVGILAIIWLVFEKTLTPLGVYLVVIPFVATSFIFYLVGGEPFGIVSNVIGAIGFCLVSLISIVYSIGFGKDNRVSVLTTFGIVGGTLYLSRIFGFLLSASVQRAGIEPQVQIAATVASLLYVFSIVGFIMMRFMRKPTTADGAGAKGTTVVDTTSLHCAKISEQYGLTKWEVQVLELLAHGQSIAGAANRLSLSENTVRTYTKRLYTALGVHSRQELIDLQEDR